MEDSWIRWKLFNGMRETENVNLQKGKFMHGRDEGVKG